KPTPRWSFFDVNSDAWRFDSGSNAYYLHYFSGKQPDLNWENPAVRREVYGIMKFWLEKGIDGFRMDAFQFVAKDTTWPVLPPGYEKQINRFYGMGPHIHEYLQEMNREVLSKHDIITVAEGAGSTLKDAHDLVDADRHELEMAYPFEAIDLGHGTPDYSLQEFKRIYSKWDSAFEDRGWLAIFLANHDQPRMVSHWGEDSGAFRAPCSKMLTTFIMTMRGTPFYYNGDEIGMRNIRFDRIEDYRDIATISKYHEIKDKGGDLKAFLEDQKNTSRDNGRTPFQWDNSVNAGFSSGMPWIKVNPDYSYINVAAEEKDPQSILNYFRRAVDLRKNNLALVYGRYALADPDNPDVYAYTREGFGKKMLILLNFRRHPALARTGIRLADARLVLDNYPGAPAGDSLRPYEARVYELPLSGDR
ncbi:MAG TPA: alpha-amylase family glycosyl hydrolase, partial [Puia sp.]|nr:alpha-amylase family glycosyl hydrolase [Puia sp.]